MTEVPKHIEVIARALASRMGRDSDESLWPHGPTALWKNFVTDAAAAAAALVEAGYVVVSGKTLRKLKFEAGIDSIEDARELSEMAGKPVVMLTQDSKPVIEAAEKP